MIKFFAGVLFFLALVAFIISIRSFMERGFLLNNAYLYATEEERARMNKKPYYRQTAIVFFAIGIIFVFNGFAVLYSLEWMVYVVMTVVILVIIYAIVSSIAIDNAARGEVVMKVFDNSQLETYKAEVQERWGNTDAYKEHAEKTKGYSKDK